MNFFSASNSLVKMAPWQAYGIVIVGSMPNFSIPPSPPHKQMASTQLPYGQWWREDKHCQSGSLNYCKLTELHRVISLSKKFTPTSPFIHPDSWVNKSSTSIGWGYGGNVASKGGSKNCVIPYDTWRVPTAVRWIVNCYMCCNFNCTHSEF